MRPNRADQAPLSQSVVDFHSRFIRTGDEKASLAQAKVLLEVSTGLGDEATGLVNVAEYGDVPGWEIQVVCEGGCGLICAGSQCWSWCEPVPDPAVIPAVMLFRSDDPADADDMPQGSTMMTMCVNGATRRSLVHVLETMIRRSLSSSIDAADDTLVEPFTGSLDELLTHHGLRRGDT